MSKGPGVVTAHLKLANDRRGDHLAPSGLGELGLQLRDEGLGTGENLAALGGFKY